MSNFVDFSEMTLDEYSILQSQGRRAENLENLSLDEIIWRCNLGASGSNSASRNRPAALQKKEVKRNQRLGYDVWGKELGEVDVSVGKRRSQRYDEDAYKSLDDIIEERNIVNPDPWKSLKCGSPLTKKTDVIIEEESGDVEETSQLQEKSQLDPLTNTLDDIAQARGIREVSTSKESRKRKAEVMEPMDVDEDPCQIQEVRRYLPARSSLTPYRVVGILSEKGMIVELKIGRRDEGESDKLPLWLCIVACGNVTGIAGSNRKVVAKEIACKNFLSTLRKCHEVPSQLFIDPYIFTLIAREAESQGVKMYYEIFLAEVETKSLRKGNPRFEYICRYYFDKDVHEGHALTSDYAKLESACRVYQAVTNKSLPITEYVEGSDCKLNVKYHFHESEVYHTLEIDEGEINTDLPPEILQAWTNDKDQALRKVTKSHFEKTQEEEFNRRRYQQVVFHNPDAESATDVGTLIKPDSPKVARGRGRGRGIIKPIVYDL